MIRTFVILIVAVPLLAVAWLSAVAIGLTGFAIERITGWRFS
jgi:hypothetical protein